MIGPGRIPVQLSGGTSARKDDAGGLGGEKKGKTVVEKKDKDSRGEKRAANGACCSPIAPWFILFFQ